MGTCGSKDTYPTPISLGEVVDLPVGGVRESATGCCASIAGAQSGGGQATCEGKGFTWPGNGEFDFHLGSGCGLCSEVGSYGCECSGSGAIGGSRPAIKRRRFGADRTTCCLNKLGSPIIGGLTCDPIYRGPSKPACRNVIIAHCDNPTNFFSATCKEYIGNLDEQIKNELGNKYCAGSNDPWCACFTAKVPPEWENDPVKKALLRCLDPTCQGGNNPEAMKPYNLTCPTTFVDCQQDDIKLKLIDSGIDKAIVEQNCGNINVGAPPGPTPDDGDGDGNEDGGNGKGKDGLSTGAKIGIIGGSVGVLIIIVVIILIAMASSKKKKGGNFLK